MVYRHLSSHGVYPRGEGGPSDLNGQTALNPYPPRGFDWQIWMCPAVFAGLMLIVVTLLFRKRTSATAQTIGGMCVAIAMLWFLLMLPKLQGAAEAGPRTQCRSNLKIIAAAVHNWHDQHERLPAPYTTVEDQPPVSWRVTLLPYLGREELRNGYDAQKAWNDPVNRPVALREPLEVYLCRTNRQPQDAEHRWYTAYAFVTGAGTPFPAEGPLTLNDISDGVSNTLLIAEACGRKIVWTEPRDVDVSQEAIEINAPGQVAGTSAGILSSWHRGGGAMCALADGSVRFLSQNTSPEALRALTTTAGEDDPGEF